jgi:hypothetical protein
LTYGHLKNCLSNYLRLGLFPHQPFALRDFGSLSAAGGLCFLLRRAANSATPAHRLYAELHARALLNPLAIKSSSPKNQKLPCYLFEGL